MHDDTDHHRSGEDEYVLDTPTIRSFVSGVREIIARTGDPAEAVESLRPLFSELLAGEGWLPEEYQSPTPESGMGAVSASGSFSAPPPATSVSSPSSYRRAPRPPCTTTSPGAWSGSTEASRRRPSSPAVTRSRRSARESPSP
jgi:hypothetical protein